MYKNKKIQNPTTGVRVDFSQLAHKILSQFPIGSITPFMAGYFTANDNTGFTMPADPSYITVNSIAAVNSYIRPKGFIICDGTAFEDKDSPIYNGAGRYCPDITDDRFLMGSVILGVAAGDNILRNHRHNYSFGTVDVSLPSFTPDAHNHWVDISSGDSKHAGLSLFGERASHVSSPAPYGGNFKLKCGTDESIGTNATSGGYPNLDRRYVSFSEFRDYGNFEYYGASDHRHTFTFQSSNSAAFDDDIDHTHPAKTLTGNVGTPGEPLPTGGYYTTIDNRPKFLSCFYMQRVK